jgi:DNA-binding IclR family transcriptional regulator
MARRTNKTKPRPRYAVPALDRGLDVLEALSASAVPQTLTDLSRTLNYAPSGLFRLLARLDTRGYVVRDAASGRYSLTLKLFELSHTHSPVESLVRAAAGPMRELAETIEESVHLSVIHRGRLLVLLDTGSPSKVRISIEAGSQFAPVETTSGRLLLSYYSPEDLAAFLARDPEYQVMAAATRRRFERGLIRIRRAGFAITRSQERAGLVDLSVLVGNPSIGQASALAIACIRRVTKAQIQEILAAMKTCAATITSAQGLSGAAS